MSGEMELNIAGSAVIVGPDDVLMLFPTDGALNERTTPMFVEYLNSRLGDRWLIIEGASAAVVRAAATAPDLPDGVEEMWTHEGGRIASISPRWTS